jgi:hypothetical protein
MTARRRWLILGFEVVLGTIYLALFAVFVTQSTDFLVVRENTRAEAVARARTPALPATFTFGEGQADNDLLGIDWWRDEIPADGIWSHAHTYAYVPVPPQSEDLKLTLDGEAFVARGHDSVQVTVDVDGSQAGSWTHRLGESTPEMSLAVPASATTDGLIELRFNVDYPAVPYHFGNQTEKREVGLLLRSMTLEAN